MTRLIKQYRDTGNIALQQRTYRGFDRVYTAEDIRLLAALDERHNTLSGPATKSFASVAFRYSSRPNTNAWRVSPLRICII